MSTDKQTGFRVERSIAIQAPPSAIVPLIDNFHRWVDWSPFEGLDPDLKRTYEGAPSGKGAIYAWSGNNKAGAGRMEITEATPTAVIIKLDFSKPFKAHNIAEFTLEPQGETTTVTWAMHGPNPFSNKLIKALMGMVFDMDKVVGAQFAQGLAKMKAAAEARTVSA
jgi:hypothetical protein